MDGLQISRHEVHLMISKAVVGYEFGIACDHGTHSLQAKIGSSTSDQFARMMTTRTERKHQIAAFMMTNSEICAWRSCDARLYSIFSMSMLMEKTAFRHAKDDQHD